MGSRLGVLNTTAKHSKMMSTSSSNLVLAATAVLAAALVLAPQPSTALKSNLCKNTTVNNHLNCAAAPNQYKCAVFYKDVPRKDNPSQTRLGWIGGLPDALRKVKVQKSAEIRATFGNVKPGSFWFKDDDPAKCDRKAAESRCYIAMDNPATRPLDSCEVNIINEEGDLTLGDLLCQNMKDSGWIPESQTEVKNQIISFYYSVCAKKPLWQPIPKGDNEFLEASEPLCCKAEGEKFRFYRCNGAPYEKSDKCAAA